MTVREMLNGYRTALIEARAIKCQIERLEASRNGYSSSTAIHRIKVPGKDEYVVMPRGNNPEAANNQAIEGCIEQLRLREEILSRSSMELEKLLDMLSDGSARAILRYYYGANYNDEWIAEEMMTVREVITRKRNWAINYLESKVTESHIKT